MGKPARLRIISQIEKARKSRLLSYVTSTRPGLEVQMAMDAIRRIYDHISPWTPRGTKVPRIDLFLYSNGGEGIVPWRLVTLLREHADEFCVLVPFAAFSAATLTALGTDHIVMHPMAMLGPTDPTVANLFNPQDPTNPTRRLGISVEDVTAYIALIRDDAGIQHEEEVVQAFDKLADKVHPLALGNVKRSLSQSRMMAKKLLSLHMHPTDDEHRIDQIVDNFTSKLFYHGHPINRREAQEELELATVEYPPLRVKKAMWQLYLHYEKEMKLNQPFAPASDFLAAFPDLKPNDLKTTAPASARLAFIESTTRSDVFSIDYELSGQKLPDGSTNVTVIKKREGWATE
jgi:hypothetical protein